MTAVSQELQCTTIANMISVELNRQHILTATDQEDKYNIIYASAEYIVFNYPEALKNIQICVDTIKEYISETIKNYPYYFVNGEEI